MNKLAQALNFANLAIAANYFLRAKTAAYVATAPGSRFDNLSNLATASVGVLNEKRAAAQGVDASEDEAYASALYDAAKGIIRMRNIQQL